MRERPKQQFYNLDIDVLDKPGFFEALERQLSEPGQITVNFLNAHCFNVAQSNREYRRALNDSTFVLNDGVGVDIAGRFCGIRFPENLNGTDLIPEMLEFFQRNGISIFCFGAKPEVIERAVNVIRIRYPQLAVAGFSHGYVTDPKAIIDRINDSGADALIVGLGVPKQELWVADYLDQLHSVRIAICGGAVFDFISGSVKRAPAILRRFRLEWLFRLAQEPVRLFSRYIFGSFKYLYHLLTVRR